jgi:2-polyprenyl-3-methyl-5-hydroxy-6-metoxy-1,4-benzoquinol methylase
MVHHKLCPLCESQNISANLYCTDNFISKEVFQIAKCLKCGFLFTQDIPDEKEIGAYYESDDYISHSDTIKGFSNKLYHLARNLMLKRKTGIVRKVTGINSGNLLDIGSGTGHFAHAMDKVGWQVKGMEINKKARNYSKQKFGLEIIDPHDILTLQPASFECITLWHVLEHFHDPFRYINEIHRLLKPEGICLIALPNSNSYDAAIYKEFWAAYDVPRHFWHFSPETFKLFIHNSGLKLFKIMNLPLDVFYISILSEKYKRSTFSFIRGIFKAIPFFLKSVYKKERSSSVIYILKKSIPGSGV